MVITRIVILISLLINANANASSIYQSSSIGEDGEVTFSTSLLGAEYVCSTLIAEGNATSIVVNFNFENGGSTSNFAGDMFLLVQQLTEDGEFVQCFQYGGYDYNYPDCGVVNKWNETWNEAGEGFFNDTVDVSRAKFSGNTWKICIGNGWANSFLAPTYEGTFGFTSSLVTIGYPPSSQPSSIPTGIPSSSHKPTGTPIALPTDTPSISLSPTSEPSTQPSSMPSVSLMPTVTSWIDISIYDEVVTLTFDAYLSGTEYTCIQFPAKNTLSTLNISLYFSGSTGSEWAYDMALALRYIPTSVGIQIGGFDFYLPGISFIGAWPTTWATGVAGQYDASISQLDQYGVTGEGNYGVCIANAWAYGNEVHYLGVLELNGLTSTRAPPPDPTSAPSPDPTSAPSKSAKVDDDDDGASNDDDDVTPDSGGDSSNNNNNLAVKVAVPIVLLVVIIAGGIAYYFLVYRKKTSSLESRFLDPSIQKSSSSTTAKNKNEPSVSFYAPPVPPSTQSQSIAFGDDQNL